MDRIKLLSQFPADEFTHWAETVMADPSSETVEQIIELGGDEELNRMSDALADPLLSSGQALAVLVSLEMFLRQKRAAPSLFLVADADGKN